ncbi:glycosyltransferase family 2 protein [Pontibacter sp. G13]|uniref:glycosyltransferase family 2 protein n=1 Tax=Pontibacter sp. G13 TaxID=3074898 RepID=UPI00288A0669|nr:glycosyltransferase family 2 protein [Pontibacter sp. G13]WNJ17671.1 glycosyltransferase family 2 protein [Pontibacter sp. G13]
MMYDLDLVVPMFRPQAGWNQIMAQRLEAFLSHLPEVKVQLILVNDGTPSYVSPDDFACLEALCAVRYESYPENQGKGYAVRHGATCSTAPFMMFTDVDFPYEAEDMAMMYQYLVDNEPDVIVGTRANTYYEVAPTFRTWVSKSLKGMIKLLMRLPISDSQGGLKAFSPYGRAVLVNTTVNRYLFDLELVKMAAHQANLQLDTLPVHLRKEIEFTSLSPALLLREGLNFLQVMFKPVKPIHKPEWVKTAKVASGSPTPENR